MTGRATPHVFNGTSFNDEKDKPLAHPLHGVLTRSHVGYLLWNREQVKHAQLPLVQYPFYVFWGLGGFIIFPMYRKGKNCVKWYFFSVRTVWDFVPSSSTHDRLTVGDLGVNAENDKILEPH